MTRLTYEDWRDFLFRIQAICSPAELQGLAGGYICGRACKDLNKDENRTKKDSDAAWLDAATQVMDLHSEDLDEATLAGLGALRETVLQALQDSNYAFEMLLPDDALPLVDRIRAVSEWAQGFLNGLGQAAEGIGEHLDDDAQSFLRDLAEVVQVDIQTEELEQNEVFLVELVEYIRIGTLSIYAQLSLSAGATDNKPALH